MNILVVGMTYCALIVAVRMPKGIQVEAMTCGFSPSSGTFAEHVPKGRWIGRRAREATADAHNGNGLCLEIFT